MNSSRSNKIYETDTGNSQITGSGNFYPGDEWRGDVARIIMYMYVRYQNQCEPINVGIGSTSYSANGDMPNILLEWNAQDSVSQYEKNRNNIFYSMQGNRNPFIDNPSLATRIWNGPTAQNTWNVALNVAAVKTDQIKIYPTLTNGLISLAGAENVVKYKIYSQVGRPIQYTERNNALDISNQENGLYFLHVQTKEGKNNTDKILLAK